MIGFSGGSVIKNPSINAEDMGSNPGSERSPGEEMATHSSILAWKITWTEEPHGLQSMGWQIVGYNWSNNTQVHVEAILNKNRNRITWYKTHGVWADRCEEVTQKQQEGQTYKTGRRKDKNKEYLHEQSMLLE